MERKLPAPKGIQMIAVFLPMAVITTTFFALRVYVRLKLVRRSWEDWAAGLGWFVYIIFCGVTIAGTFYGTGEHVEDVSPEMLAISLRMWLLGETTYVITNLFVKLSIALMLLRYAIEPYQKRLIYIIAGTFLVYSVVYLFVFTFQCLPISYFWGRFLGATNGRCMDKTTFLVAGYIYPAVTIVYDWTMAILPWFIVRKMQLDLRTRIMVAAVLALGSIASITTLIRLPYIVDLADAEDFLYVTVDVAIWACIETGLSIIASSATTLKPLFRRKSPRNDDLGRITPKLNTISVASTGESDDSTIFKQCGSEVIEVRHNLEV